MTPEDGWHRPPWATTTSPPPWSDYGPPRHSPEMPERVRAVEEIVRLQHISTTERLAAHVGRMEGQDRRLEACDARMNDLKARLRHVEDQAAKVAPLELRVSTFEKRWDVIKYMVAGVLLAATATGNMTVEQAIKLLRLASGVP